MSKPLRNTRSGLLAALIATVALLAVATPSSQAAAGPEWKVDSYSNTTAQPGDILDYRIEITNVGDSQMSGAPITLAVTLPSGLSVLDPAIGSDPSNPHYRPGGNYYLYYRGSNSLYRCTAPDGSPLQGGEAGVRCENSEPVGSNAEGSPNRSEMLFLPVHVDATQPGTLVTKAEVTGGGAAAAATADPVRVSAQPAGFGIDAFDFNVTDESGNSFRAASGHPAEVVTNIAFNTVFNPQPISGGLLWPAEATRSSMAFLPPGFVGNPAATATCTLGQLANGTGVFSFPLCKPESQVGTADIQFNLGNGVINSHLPLYNLVPPPGFPARFAFSVLGTLVVIDTTVRTDGDYGLTVASRKLPQSLATAGFTPTFWGLPGDPIHKSERACEGGGAPSDGNPTCESNRPDIPFFRNPSHCQASLESSLHMDSWEHPGALNRSGEPDLTDPNWKSMTSTFHEAPGYPYPPSERGPETGIEDCGDVPFDPTLSVRPTTNAAASPSGLDVNLSVPQDCWEDIEAICQSDLRDAVVTLPQGMSINPSAASGLASCSPAQMGLTSPKGVLPARFDTAPVSCPDASKIGEISIDTPLLGENESPDEKDLTGAVYLAKQGDNPLDSLLAMYFVARGSGVVVKQVGKIGFDSGGRLVTSFDEAPQTPFTRLHLELFGGPRAALRTPASCGAHTTDATFVPWSGNPAAQRSSSFTLTQGPGGAPCPTGAFDPKLAAGTVSPLSGIFTPFNLRLTRGDGSAELGGLTLNLPEGLIGKLAGTAYCPEAALASISGAEGAAAGQIASPGCPASSLVGAVTVGAGAGPTPFYTREGRAYLAGPYKGAPLSLAVVVPALAGPFDLGNVVVRNAVRVDRASTRLTVASDPFPSALYGIPLDIHDVQVSADRSNFTLNPTSCDPMAITAEISSISGAIAERSQPFQVGACERLAFKPKLSLQLKGDTEIAGNPALKATLTMPPGGANIARASVALPRAEFLDQAHIGTVCTRVQFAADACPARSVYGSARAFSPLLDQPLQGPVYLRSSNHQLPDLVASLHGQIDVEVSGRIDSVNKGIRTTFEAVPDAPVSKFVLSMKGGKKGLLQNSRNICARAYRATALFDGQNGKTKDLSPPLKAKCPKAKRRAGKGS